MKHLREILVNFIKIKFHNIANIENDVDDIVNDSYMQLYQSKNFKPENENFGYLAKICINNALQLYKKYKAEISKLIDVEDMDNKYFPSHSEQPGFLDPLDIEYLNKMLDDLNEMELVIIRMYYYDDISLNNIAQATGTNYNTVVSHHRRALEKLRIELSRSGLIEKIRIAHYADPKAKNSAQSCFIPLAKGEVEGQSALLFAILCPSCGSVNFGAGEELVHKCWYCRTKYKV